MTADRIDQLLPSGIRAIWGLAAAREKQGLPVIHMEAGEPYFPTPSHAIEAAFEAARDGFTGYTPNLGIYSLRTAVSERTAAKHGIDLAPENVCITTGAVMGLFLALMATVNPGDEVLVPDPGWPNYRSAIVMAGATAVPYRLGGGTGYDLDMAAVEEALTDKTTAIMINTPGNPTGAVLTEGQLLALLQLAEERDLYVISDEVYEDFVFEGRHNSVLVNGLTDRLLVVSGASKSYAMTGWRIGWLIASETLIAASSKMVEPLTSCPTSVSQVAAEAALLGPQEIVAEMREAYQRGTALAVSILKPAGLITFEPEGAFYLLIDISSSGLSSDDFARQMLDDIGVAVAPGSTFGTSADHLVRISTALPDDVITDGCTKIRDYLVSTEGAA